MVFVNAAGNLVKIDLQYTPMQIIPTASILSSATFWRNAAISKDGRFIAGLTNDQDNTIYVYDRQTQTDETFILYNPTYSQNPTVTGEVRYADVLEFDYSGQYIMYDAYNELSSTSNGNISYWDIGFLQFWENGGFANGNKAFISKLFSGLPEKTSIGNPAFAKNAPYIIAFDFIDDASEQYDIYGANVETGDYNIIVTNNGGLGWPNYNRLDNTLIYQGPNSANVTNIYRRGLAADKISPSGNETQFIATHRWGVWYADGLRNLSVSAGEPATRSFRLTVSPNPARERAFLHVEAPAAATAQIRVFDMLGAPVQTVAATLATGENRIELDLSRLPAGVYVVRLSTGTGNAAVQLVKGQ
jgi:hypothetical protein